jgi:5-hydroxyisourate hydrolase
MSPLTTHVLDTTRGTPASGIAVTLEIQAGKDAWKSIAKGVTDSDGRVKTLLPDGSRLAAATYRLTFDTGAYFRATGTPSFYPYVSIVFETTGTTPHLHVPVLLSPHGYTTYRGS